ncbi:MAG: alanine racemase, partial [Gammaproteobacteria bacterium]
MTRPARVVVDLEATQANLKRVRQAAPGRRIMAVIKADAYGHGLVPMAQALASAEAFGVACLEET